MRYHSSLPAGTSPRFHFVTLLLASCALIALAGCGASTTQQSVPTPAPTPTIAATSTPSAPPKIIFQADWSHGAGAWKLPPHWFIHNGALVTDGETTEPLPVPYTVTASNYRVVFTSRMVDVTYKNTSCNNYYGIKSLSDSGEKQFQAQSACFGPFPYHGDSELAGADGTGPVWELTIGGNERTSRVDVRGKIAAYFPTNTGSIGTIQNEQTNSPAHLYLIASQVKVVITSFAIWTL